MKSCLLLLSRNILGPMVHTACVTKEEVLHPTERGHFKFP